MLAVIKTGGKQYIVQEGDTLRVEKLDAEEGKKVNFDVLLVGDTDGKNAVVGSPTVAGAKVTGVVKAQGRAKKVRVEKFKAKTRYYKRAGHRQPYTEVTIEKIAAK